MCYVVEASCIGWSFKVVVLSCEDCFERSCDSHLSLTVKACFAEVLTCTSKGVNFGRIHAFQFGRCKICDHKLFQSSIYGFEGFTF